MRLLDRRLIQSLNSRDLDTRDARPAIPLLSEAALTPGITRRPERLLEHDKQRVGGRVHAVVRLRVSGI
jgi:hypothetical protein